MQTPSALLSEQVVATAPDHTELPDEDGTFMHNFQELPQRSLLSGSLRPRLKVLHPDEQYCIGCDSGIYWKLTQPVLAGCKAPDWFYIPDVPPMLNGELRRSYVLWQEGIRPVVVMEYASGDGREERDTTPGSGKFWVYERAIGAAYYAIYEVTKARVELHKLNGARYILVPPNAAGRFPIDVLGVELGIWHGTYQGQELPWLRVWDSETGKLLSSTEEREEAQERLAETEKTRADTAEGLLDDTRRMLQEECERAEEERRKAEKAGHEAEEQRRKAEKAGHEAVEQRRKAEQERQRAARLAEKLREMGIDPDAG
jgi:Uma2 family endonuclease